MNSTAHILVPVVFGLGHTWAAQCFKRGMGSSIGFGSASALGLTGSVFALIGTQAMTGREPFLSVFPSIAIGLMIVNGIASAVGLLPLRGQLGARTWGFGVLGFVVGAFLGGLVGTAMLLQGRVPPLLTYVLNVPFGLPGWLPSIVGGVTLAYTVKQRGSVDVNATDGLGSSQSS